MNRELLAWTHDVRFDGLAIGGVIALYLAVGLLVPPTGEFPQCDDWDYAETVRHLQERGRLTLSDYPTATLITHVLWGAAFTSVLGPTYLALRLSMFAMSALGAVGLYLWGRDCGWNRVGALWIASLYALNPLTLCFQYSFMTDVTGASLTIWLTLLLVRWQGKGGGSDLLLGTFAAVCYLARQITIIPFLVYIALELRFQVFGRGRATRLALLAAPLIITVIAHHFWLQQIHGLPYWAAQSFLRWPSIGLLHRFTSMLACIPFQLAPLCAGLIGPAGISRRAWSIAAGVWAACCALMLLSRGEIPAPYAGLEFFDLGLGFGDSLAGREALRGPVFILAGVPVSVFRLVTTPIALASLLGLLAIMIERCFTNRSPDAANKFVDPSRLVGWSAVGLGALLLLIVGGGDRYLFPLIVLCLMWFVRLPASIAGQRRPALTGVILGLIFGAVSLVGIQDNLTRTAAVWRAFDRLHSTGVEPKDINGGMEYAGVFRFSPEYRGPQDQHPYLLTQSAEVREFAIAWFGPQSYFVKERPYLVSLQKAPGYTIWDEFPYRSWLRGGVVYVLKRQSARL